MRLDIVLPAYNEEEQIVSSIATLDAFMQANLSDWDYKIILGDNASKDRTVQFAREAYKDNPRVEVFELGKKGRGRVLMAIWGSSNADICAYMDVDLATDLNGFPNLLKAITEKGFDVAIGSRNLPDSKVNRGLKRTVTSKCYAFLMRMIMRTGFTDGNCGFKAASRKAIDTAFPLIDPSGWDRGNPNGSAWFWDVEFLVICERLGFKIYEEPVRWNDDPGTTVRILRDSYEQMRGLFRLSRTKPWKKYLQKNA